MAYVGFIVVVIGAILCLWMAWGIFLTNVEYAGEGIFEWVVATALLFAGLGLSYAAWNFAPFRAVMTIGGGCG